MKYLNFLNLDVSLCKYFSVSYIKIVQITYLTKKTCEQSRYPHANDQERRDHIPKPKSHGEPE